MSHKKPTLTEGNIKRQLIALTIPMIWGVFAILSFNLVDTYFVAKLGTVPLAAISFTFPIVMVLGFFIMGIATAATSLVSRAIGNSDHSKVLRFGTDALLLGLVMVFIFTYIGLKTIDPLFKSLGAQSDTLPYIKEYMSIWYKGIIFLVVPIVGNYILRASGDMKLPALLMTVSAGLNIILDPCFIFGFSFFPEMGVRGAALATVISRSVMFFVVLFILFRRKLISFKVLNINELLSSWLELIRIGLPISFSFIMIPIAMAVITRFVSSFGTNAIAAFGVATRVEGFVFIIIMALGSGIAPFVGQNAGAKKTDRINIATNLVFKFSLLWGIAVAVLLAIFSKSIVAIFDKDPDVISIATLYFLIVPISYGAHAIISVSCSIYNALGKSLFTSFLIFLRVFVLYIPLAYMGRKFFGITGIFLASMLANFLVGFTAYILDRKLRCV